MGTPRQKTSHWMGGYLAQLAVALLCVSMAMPVLAQRIFEVQDPDNLTRLLKEAEPGTIFELAEGNYGPLIIEGVKGRPAARITLRPASETAEVRFSLLDLRDSSFIDLTGFTFDYVFKEGDAPDMRPFQINNSQEIRVLQNVFDGDVAQGMSAKVDGLPTAFGLALRGVADTLIVGNELRGFSRGLQAVQSGGLTIQRNEIHNMRMDGMNFAQVQAVRIEGNQIHSFAGSGTSGDRVDMIQFSTGRTDVPSSDIVIKDNVLNSGNGRFTHSIFMRNEQVESGLAGEAMYFRDVLIENNTVLNAHLNGIFVGETVGLTVRNNTVLHNAASDGTGDDPKLWIPQIRVASGAKDVVITRNVTSAVTGYQGQPDWSVEDNLLVQDTDPSQPNHYDEYFLAARTGNPTDLTSFSYLAGKGLDGLRMGASQLVRPQSAQTLVVAAEVTADPPYLNRFIFDASQTVGPSNLINSDTRYQWQIGEKTTLEGRKVTHTFAQPGQFDATLTVIPPEGEAETITLSVSVPNVEVITFASSEGIFRAWRGANSARAVGTPAVVGPAPLNNGRARIEIQREDMLPFFSAKDFEIGMRIRAANTYRSAGELLRIPRNLEVKITGRGALEMVLNTATSDRMRLRTPTKKLTDGNWHDIRIVYSSARGEVDVYLDEELVATGQTTGPVRNVDHWGLEFGNPFDNAKSFDGELDSFYLRANVENFAVD